MNTTPGYDRWREDLVLSRIKAARFEVLSRILAAAATANEAPEETAKRLVGSVCMKAVELVLAASLSIGLIACGKASPAAPSKSADVTPLESASQLRSIIWGTSVQDGSGVTYQVGVDPQSVTVGGAATAYVKRTANANGNRTYNLAYGLAVTGPSSVTIPSGQAQASFAVTTHNNGEIEAFIQAYRTGSGTATMPGSFNGITSIIWGT